MGSYKNMKTGRRERVYVSKKTVTDKTGTPKCLSYSDTMTRITEILKPRKKNKPKYTNLAITYQFQNAEWVFSRKCEFDELTQGKYEMEMNRLRLKAKKSKVYYDDCQNFC